MSQQQITAEQCEQIFRAALAAGDVQGVEAALTALAFRDPRRAELLYDTLKVGLAIARERPEVTTNPDACENCDCCWEPDCRHGCERPKCPCGRVSDIEEAHGEALLDDLYHDWPGEPASLADDPPCCPGRRIEGSPIEIHTDDCPVYLIHMAAINEQYRPREKQTGPYVGPVAAAYRAGVAKGRADAGP